MSIFDYATHKMPRHMPCGVSGIQRHTMSSVCFISFFSHCRQLFGAPQTTFYLYLCNVMSAAMSARRAEISKRFEQPKIRECKRGVCLLFDSVPISFPQLLGPYIFSLTISCYKQIKDVITQFNA